MLYGFTLLYDSLTLLVIHRHACVLRRFNPVIDVTIVVSVTLLNPTSQYGFIETERTPWKKKKPKQKQQHSAAVERKQASKTVLINKQTKNN